MALVSMPQAAVDEDHGTVFWQGQVRAPRQIPTMQAVAEPQGKESTPDHVLRLRVLAANPRHAVAALFCGEDVGHSERQSTTAPIQEQDVRG